MKSQKKIKQLYIHIIIILLATHIIFLMCSCSCNGGAATEKQITTYVNENYEELTAFSEELLERYPDSDLPLFVGENGYWTMVESSNPNILSIMICEIRGHRYIQYGFKNIGTVVSGKSYDFVYSPDDVPVSHWYSEEYKLEKTGDNEWTWYAGGDNGGMIRKIRDKFYLCENWC